MMVTSKSVLGASLAETIEADLAQPQRRVPRADRPLPGVAPIMALAGRDGELSKLEGQLGEASQTIARLERELAEAQQAGAGSAGEVSRISAELDAARAAMKDSSPTKLLAPEDVLPSRFTNRHPDSYRDAEYVSLREEIRAAGGNTQPIGVRPKPHQPGKYELSFGSRRRQACLELGLPVLAMIQEMDEVTLFERMERENRQRKDLRPYEQGVLYQQALDAKLYPSVRKLADSLQIDSGGLTRLLAVARLPGAVLDAFQSPLEIQAKWGPVLSEAIERNPDALLAKAAELKAAAPRLAAQRVFEALVVCAAEGRRPTTVPLRVELQGSDGQVATITYAKNTASVAIKNLTEGKRAALERALRKYLG